MNKFRVTIIIPSTGSISSSLILQSFLTSEPHSIYVQFVFLLNKKNCTKIIENKIEQFGSHQIISVANDRYFGSCEENLYRSGDFSNLFCERVFCVGEHDYIDWAELELALENFDARALGVMGWNIKSQQNKTDGGFTELSAITPLNIDSSANEFCQVLLRKGVLNSAIAFPALISLYGPIDWAAYLGNHLFRKDIFQKVLQYKFSEHVYSLVYKQLKFFSSNQIRYGFYTESVIRRISDDFLKINTGNHSHGWLTEHRAVHGLSHIFWISNLQYLNELKSNELFNLVSNSTALSHQPGANETIDYGHSFTLPNFLSWADRAIKYKLKGDSHYFARDSKSSSMSDIYTVCEYLKILLSEARRTTIYNGLGEQVFSHLRSAALTLEQYLGASVSSDFLLENCIRHLEKAIELLNRESLTLVNEKSFIQYCEIL